MTTADSTMSASKMSDESGAVSAEALAGFEAAQEAKAIAGELRAFPRGAGQMARRRAQFPDPSLVDDVARLRHVLGLQDGRR